MYPRNSSMSTTRRRTKKRPTDVPRRAAVLELLARKSEPLSEQALFRAFQLRTRPARDELRGRLERMCRDGQILCDRRGRFALPARMDMVRGRVTGHPDGYGFLTPEHGGADLFVPAREMRKVLHGDRVVGRAAGVDRRGRREATIVEVIERANRTVVGRYVVEQGLGFVIPDNARISQDVFIAPEGTAGAQPEQIVVVEITRQPDQHVQPMGRIVEVLGDHMAPGMEIEIAIRKYELPHQWPREVATEAKRVEAVVDRRHVRKREDLRALALVTIDGEDARDFDDAVYCERRRGGWRLIVAIADVAHYVAAGSALDQEAYLRGNSVYFPAQVIPMLPEALSNGICSLNPEVDRLCLACELDISHQGNVKRYRFFDAVMRSHARLTYNEVAAALDGSDADAVRRLQPLSARLETLHAVSQALRERRMREGSIDFELPETRIRFDDQRKIERIEPLQRTDAHRLIEECMLAANVCAADLLLAARAPGVYRIHERPDEAKLADVRQFLAEFGLSLGGGDEPSAVDYTEVVLATDGKPHAHVVQMALLRSLRQATYSAENIGHFALGFDRYTHFTSPIRRYPDLLVHRVIKRILRGERIEIDEVDRLDLDRSAEHCSMTERRADDATRDVVQWLKAEYMLDRIGEEFTGVVTGVTDFGIFVELEQVYVEGLVHVTALGDDYFRFDPVGRRLNGERTGARYQLGDRIKVKVVRVDLDEAKIDFELADGGGERRRRRRRR